MVSDIQSSVLFFISYFIIGLLQFFCSVSLGLGLLFSLSFFPLFFSNSYDVIRCYLEQFQKYILNTYINNMSGIMKTLRVCKCVCVSGTYVCMCFIYSKREKTCKKCYHKFYFMLFFFKNKQTTTSEYLYMMLRSVYAYISRPKAAYINQFNPKGMTYF